MWWMTLALAGTLGGVLYLITSSVPFLVSSPTTDPNFGALNSCVLKNLKALRLGYAVSWDRKQLVAFSAEELLWCKADGEPHRQALPGITQASFDGKGRLWLATRGSDEAPPQLWLSLAEQAKPFSAPFAPTSLVGTKTGAVILDAKGQVTAIRSTTDVGGTTSLNYAVNSPTGLITSADGTMTLLVAGTGIFAFRSDTAELVRKESPCEVEYAWWLPNSSLARIACGPEKSWAIDMSLVSGASEKASLSNGGPSVLLPTTGIYVESCDRLPCTASPP